MKKFVSFATIAAVIALAVVLQTTSPSDSGPVGILAVFFLCYVGLIGVFTWLIFFGAKLARGISKTLQLRKPLREVSFLRSYYFASVIALAPVILLAMGSIGELGMYEVGLVFLFVAIATFYVAKRTN